MGDRPDDPDGPLLVRVAAISIQTAAAYARSFLLLVFLSQMLDSVCS